MKKRQVMPPHICIVVQAKEKLKSTAWGDERGYGWGADLLRGKSSLYLLRASRLMTIIDQTRCVAIVNKIFDR